MSTKATPDHSESESEVDEEEPPKILQEISHTQPDIVCKLCFRPAQDPEGTLKLGALYQFGYCVAHLYCLMFSSGLDQNGEDEEGINGFLPEDIVKEWRRGQRLKCFYCNKTYATVGCVGKGCKKSYHLSCGLENGSLQQFFGSFSSFCQDHRPVQAPLAKAKKKNTNESLKVVEECGVCLEELEEKPSNSTLWTPCCGGWFHRSCVERMAETAGCHFFKCPLCNNSKDFSDEMQQFGIYLPDQDAQWETGDAFDDQLQRHDRCDAEHCLCPSGPKYDEEDTLWEIMLCVCCGAQGIHVECGNLDLARPRWKCGFCKTVVANLPNKPIPVFTRVKRSLDPPNKDFSRKVLENLSFKVTKDYEITIDMFKNRKNPKERRVARFQVTGMPAVDIPNQVKVHKSENVGDKIKNIPCPFEDCTELVSRQQFKEHCRQHREGSKEPENQDDNREEKENDGENDKTVGWDGNGWVKEVSLKKIKMPEDSTPVKQILEVVTPNKETEEIINKTPQTKNEQPSKEIMTPQTLNEQLSKENITPQTLNEQLNKENRTPQSKNQQSSKENRTPQTLSEPPSKRRKKDHSDEKQRSILSFFAKFSPKVGSETKSPKKQVESPGSPNLRAVKSPVKSVVMKTPEKKVISSPIGYFKVDEEISIRTPVKNMTDKMRQEWDDTESIVSDDHDEKCDISKEDGDETSISGQKEIPKSKFQCQYCKITFSNLLSWKSHENSHKGVSHNCAVCEEKFPTEAKLEKHTKAKHMGREGDEKITPLKMFFCEFCEYTSKYRGNIKKHTQNKHKDATQSSDKAGSESSEKSSVEGSEKSVIVIRSPSPINEIIDIEDDEVTTNKKVENLLNDWD